MFLALQVIPRPMLIGKRGILARRKKNCGLKSVVNIHLCMLFMYFEFLLLSCILLHFSLKKIIQKKGAR